MRGGLQLSEAYNTTFEERRAIGKMVEANLKTTKESHLPFF